MVRARKTAFDRYRNQKLKDPEFAREYLEARSEIDAIDQLIRSLDEARAKSQLSKAELARRIDATPEIVRRLFTTSQPNPTISTLVKIALALGLRLELVHGNAGRSHRGPAAERKRRPAKQRRSLVHQVATLRGRRARNSSPSLKTAP